MKIAIVTKGSKGAYLLADAASALGHDVIVKDFTAHSDRESLRVADIFILRFSHASYENTIRLAEEFSKYNPQGVLSVSATGVERSFDKFLAYIDMMKEGVPTPHTWLLQQSNEETTLYPMLPLILKPRTENQGRNIVVARTPRSLSLHVRKLLSAYGSCIAQDFIAETAGRDIRAFVIGDTVVAAMERVAQSGQLANLSQGGSAFQVKLTKEEKRIAVKASQMFGAHYSGVDILRSNAGPLVIEVNVSPGFKIASIVDKDIPRLVIQHLVAVKGRVA